MNTQAKGCHEWLPGSETFSTVADRVGLRSRRPQVRILPGAPHFLVNRHSPDQRDSTQTHATTGERLPAWLPGRPRFWPGLLYRLSDTLGALRDVPGVFVRSLRRSWRQWHGTPPAPLTSLQDAAPDLLAACRDVLRVLEDPRCTFSMPHTLALVRAAVAKAEGRAGSP